MHLDYLDFDFSEDGAGNASWDAMACVDAQHLNALCAEICALLAWAHQALQCGPAPLDDGGLWDCDLQCERSNQPLLTLHYDAGANALVPAPLQWAPAPSERVTLTLTLCAAPSAAPLFAQQFVSQY